MVVVIPGVVVTLIALFVLNQALGGRNKPEPLKGWMAFFVGVTVVVGFAAMVWSIQDEEQKKKLIEFWSDFF